MTFRNYVPFGTALDGFNKVTLVTNKGHRESYTRNWKVTDSEFRREINSIASIYRPLEEIDIIIERMCK